MTSSSSEPRPFPAETPRPPFVDVSPRPELQQPHPPPDRLPVIDRRVRRIIDGFAADLGRPWRVRELAEEAGVTPRQLERLFKGATGFAPLQLLKTLRLDRARQELVETTKSIKQIAAEVGYDSANGHFNHDFLARFDLSPRDYRRLHGDPAAEKNAAG